MLQCFSEKMPGVIFPNSKLGKLNEADSCRQYRDITALSAGMQIIRIYWVLLGRIHPKTLEHGLQNSMWQCTLHSWCIFITLTDRWPNADNKTSC